MGFSFRHFSSIYGKAGDCYFLCYDYGFRPIVEKSMIQKVLIVQQQPYMRKFDPWEF